MKLTKPKRTRRFTDRKIIKRGKAMIVSKGSNYCVIVDGKMYNINKLAKDFEHQPIIYPSIDNDYHDTATLRLKKDVPKFTKAVRKYWSTIYIGQKVLYRKYSDNTVEIDHWEIVYKLDNGDLV